MEISEVLGDALLGSKYELGSLLDLDTLAVANTVLFCLLSKY